MQRFQFFTLMAMFACAHFLGCQRTPVGGPPEQSSTLVSVQSDLESAEEPTTTGLRVATFNISFYRDIAGKLAEDLADGNDAKAHKIAHIIQIVRPDILLLNEFDFDEQQTALAHFQKHYLSVAHDDTEPIEFPFTYTNEVNTGEPSGIDLDNDGTTDGWNDCFGFGKYPGQYGMAVVSRFPIDEKKTRTFRKLKWTDMPDAHIPTMPDTGENFYSDEALAVFRLSSKSHWDVHIDVDGSTFHFLVAHPTPPVFDGPEDRNGKRNHDEIRLFADYISGGEKASYIIDDAGNPGGLERGSHFVIAGDMNADPHDGDSFMHAARLLTEHPAVSNSSIPHSEGAVEVGSYRANAEHQGDASCDTGDFDDRRTGNLRIDYVLPSNTMSVKYAGVFWPKKADPRYDLIHATDHRMTWIDLEITRTSRE